YLFPASRCPSWPTLAKPSCSPGSPLATQPSTPASCRFAAGWTCLVMRGGIFTCS
ncbi:hypothetical protein MCOR06_011417, partial [Pyricularia oryzae]